MTSAGITKIEELTFEFETWEYDPSVLTPVEDEKNLFEFPDEIQAFFVDLGLFIYAQTGEVFEATEVDGKDAFVSIGMFPVAVITALDDEDVIYEDDEESDDAVYLTEGGKIILFGGYGEFRVVNTKHVLVKFN